MSWGAILLRLPPHVTLDELPDDWQPPSFGAVADIRRQFERAFPGQHHADGQSCVEGETFWIEFNYRSEKSGGEVESIGIRSNAGPGAMAVMQRACDVLGLRMVDCQTGQLADFSSETQASIDGFCAWRDRVLHGRDDEP
jgi:hypothetical protein